MSASAAQASRRPTLGWMQSECQETPSPKLVAYTFYGDGWVRIERVPDANRQYSSQLIEEAETDVYALGLPPNALNTRTKGALTREVRRPAGGTPAEQFAHGLRAALHDWDNQGLPGLLFALSPEGEHFQAEILPLTSTEPVYRLVRIFDRLDPREPVPEGAHLQRKLATPEMPHSLTELATGLSSRMGAPEPQKPLPSVPVDF